MPSSSRFSLSSVTSGLINILKPTHQILVMSLLLLCLWLYFYETQHRIATTITERACRFAFEQLSSQVAATTASTRGGALLEGSALVAAATAALEQHALVSQMAWVLDGGGDGPPTSPTGQQTLRSVLWRAADAQFLHATAFDERLNRTESRYHPIGSDGDFVQVGN